MHATTENRRPKPIALCLERLAADPEDRYVRCTAEPGRDRGLALGLDGRILWREPGPVGCEIWVTQDERLVAFCPADSPPTVLHRARRALELPKEKPVVVRNQDELAVAGTRFRVHVHGTTNVAHAPTVLRDLARVAASVALALTVGASTGCASKSAAPLQGKDAGGSVQADQPDASPDEAFARIKLPDAPPSVDTEASDVDEAQDADEIEVRESPPLVI